MTRLGLTQAADMAATIRNDLALEGASECVLNALRVLENKLRPVPGKRTGRPRSATTPEKREMIKVLRDSGLTQAAIAREVGVSEDSVQRALSE